jgi:hypothetical protein
VDPFTPEAGTQRVAQARVVFHLLWTGQRMTRVISRPGSLTLFGRYAVLLSVGSATLWHQAENQYQVVQRVKAVERHMGLCGSKGFLTTFDSFVRPTANAQTRMERVSIDHLSSIGCPFFVSTLPVTESSSSSLIASRNSLSCFADYARVPLAPTAGDSSHQFRNRVLNTFT